MRVAPALRSFTCFFAVGVIALAATAQARCLVRAGDEVLEVNVRPACCTTDVSRLSSRMQINEYVAMGEGGRRQWIDSDLSRLVAPASPGVTTLFFVHGNKVDACMARDRGLRVYRSLVRHSCDTRPIRFVIFSWPAAEIGGLLNDFRVKAARTRPVGWELAWILNQMPPDTPTSVLAYSYGARIAGGAMHLRAGGSLSGLCLHDENSAAQQPLRVAFLAAATHAQWFGPRGYHGMAMHQIDHLLLLNNERDPAMRFYKWVDKGGNPQAMGLCGPTCLSTEARQRVECYNCSKCVGRSHDLFKYVATGRTMTRVWQHLTYADN